MFSQRVPCTRWPSAMWRTGKLPTTMRPTPISALNTVSGAMARNVSALFLRTRRRTAAPRWRSPQQSTCQCRPCCRLRRVGVAAEGQTAPLPQPSVSKRALATGLLGRSSSTLPGMKGRNCLRWRSSPKCRSKASVRSNLKALRAAVARSPRTRWSARQVEFVAGGGVVEGVDLLSTVDAAEEELEDEAVEGVALHPRRLSPARSRANDLRRGLARRMGPPRCNRDRQQRCDDNSAAATPNNSSGPPSNVAEATSPELLSALPRSRRTLASGPWRSGLEHRFARSNADLSARTQT